MNENEISNVIIGSAIEVHNQMGGPGLLENVYEEALCHEMMFRGLDVLRQQPVAVMYKGVQLKSALYLDVLVGGTVIVEVKAVENFNSIYTTQLLTYLRLSERKLGLVINFGERFIKNGIHRVVNGL